LGNVPGEVLKSLISAVGIGPGQLAVTLDRADLALRLGVEPDVICDDGLMLEADFSCRKRGVETRIVMADGSARPDKVLIAAITKAHAWWAALRSGMSMRDIAEKEGVSQRRIALLISLAFLAPDITEAILQGRQPVTLTTDALVRNLLPISWDEQREALAFSQR
jgi:site-specific DNA recombinase